VAVCAVKFYFGREFSGDSLCILLSVDSKRF
jgi:hypothetical protein